MSILAKPMVGYVGAVLGVIAIASLAVFNLRGMAAKAHRHWDADIDRIIARQQAKKHDRNLALARAEVPAIERDAGPQIAALTRETVEEEEADDVATVTPTQSGSQKVQNQSGKKNTQRVEKRRQHYIPTAFATLPKFAATAAATTTTWLRVR